MGNSFALHAELVGVMITIETVVVRGWTKHWIERDSMLVIKAFKTSNVIHCKLRNRWLNCINMAHSMSFTLSHVYCEDNFCADKLTSHDSFTLLVWWDSLLFFYLRGVFKIKELYMNFSLCLVIFIFFFGYNIVGCAPFNSP